MDNVKKSDDKTQRKFGMLQIIPLATALLSIVWIVIGVKDYGFWDGLKGPSKGFFPIIISILMLAVSVFAFLKSFSEDEEPGELPRENWHIVYAAVAIFALTHIIGMLPTLIIFMIGWLRFYEKTPWKPTIIVTLVVSLIVGSMFVFWLKVPFPKGWIVTTLFGG